MSGRVAFVSLVTAALGAALLAPTAASANDWQTRHHGFHGGRLVGRFMAPAWYGSYPGRHGPIGLCRPTGQNFLCQ